MKYLFFLTVSLTLIIACNKNDCKIEEKTLATGEKRIDSNINSPYHGQTVLDFFYSWKAKVESGEFCKSSTCISMKSMTVINLSPKDIDLTLSLAGRGDFTFFINKGDTISINPLPDFCVNDTWGTIKEIRYK